MEGERERGTGERGGRKGERGRREGGKDGGKDGWREGEGGRQAPKPLSESSQILATHF